MAFASRPPLAWRIRSRTIATGARTLLMGILNLTPDSFSDGGENINVDHAVARATEMLEQGADILDLGGESTRPGAAPTPADEELARVLPVLERIVRAHPSAIVSVDTYRAATAQAALAAGAHIINDVSGGLWDGAMLPLCAETRCGVVLTHTRGRPGEWSSLPALQPEEVIPLVLRDLRARSAAALSAGVAPENIVLDPGFGFGKSLDENLPLLADLSQLQSLGYPVLAGVSRKGFLRNALRSSEPLEITSEALHDATLAANTAAILAGADIVRVHDVATARRAATVADRILQSHAKARSRQ